MRRFELAGWSDVSRTSQEEQILSQHNPLSSPLCEGHFSTRTLYATVSPAFPSTGVFWTWQFKEELIVFSWNLDVYAFENNQIASTRADKAAAVPLIDPGVITTVFCFPWPSKTGWMVELVEEMSTKSENSWSTDKCSDKFWKKE